MPGTPVTAPVILQFPTTASYEQQAIPAAQTLLAEHRSALRDATITLTDLSWTVTTGPDDLDRARLLEHADQPALRPPLAAPASIAGLAAARRARDEARHRLDWLERQIRERAIHAVLDDILADDFATGSQEIDRILQRLGLDGLPRAHQLAVTADLTLHVAADDADQAYRTVGSAMSTFVARFDTFGSWTRSGFTDGGAPRPGQGRWRIGWHLEYLTAVRGHLTTAGASAAAEQHLRSALAPLLHGGDQDLTITATLHSFGIDPNLNPDTD